MLLQINLPDRQKAFLVGRLGDIEYRLSIGCQDSLALASLIGAFVEIRHLGK